VNVSKAEQILAQAAAEPDRPRRHLLVAAALREVLGTEPIVVGGAAEDHYAGGLYLETDLDLCGWVSEVEESVLVQLGFERAGRHRLHKASGVAVEFPEARIDGDESRVIHVDMGLGSAAVIGVDDLYLDRIRQATAEADGGTQFRAALGLVVADPDAIDWPYIERVLERTRSGDAVLGRAMGRLDANVRATVRRLLDEG
jgi:hypothetical protein